MSLEDRFQKMNPDANIQVGHLTVKPEGETLAQDLANLGLALLHIRYRWWTVQIEEMLITFPNNKAAFYATPENAARIAGTATIGKDGNFVLPGKKLIISQSSCN